MRPLHLAAIAGLAALPALAAGQTAQVSPAGPPQPPTPKLVLGATSLAFGNVIYGGKPAAQAFVIRNDGAANLTLLGFETSGNSDFSIVQTCGVTIAPAKSCTATVTFSPHAIGARSGKVTIKSNSPGSPHTVDVTGTGCRYFSPAAARFFLTSC